MKEQALEIFRRIGNKFGERVTILNIGEVLFAQGRLADARTKYDEAMAGAQQLGDKRGIGYCLVDIAGVLIAQDRLDDARTAAEHSIEIRKEIHGEVQIGGEPNPVGPDPPGARQTRRSRTLGSFCRRCFR